MRGKISSKVKTILPLLEKRFGVDKRIEPVPPPSSAEAEAAAAVARKNSQLIAEIVLGLHGPPKEGADAARRLMAHFVDWNEVRVSRTYTLLGVLGKLSRAEARITLLKRFMEAFFLRRRNLNLECIFDLKVYEARRLLEDLAIFERDEVQAVLLLAFGAPAFPPDGQLLPPLVRLGILSPKTTVLQMAKQLSKGLDEDSVLRLYSKIYALRRRFCTDENPLCRKCPLMRVCPAAKEFKAERAKKERAKARKQKKAVGSGNKKASVAKSGSKKNTAPRKTGKTARKSAGK